MFAVNVVNYVWYLWYMDIAKKCFNTLNISHYW
jgi:hypothetical protein